MPSLTVAMRAAPNITDYLQIVGSPEALSSKTVPDYEFLPAATGISGAVLMSQVLATPSSIAMRFEEIDQMAIRARSTNKIDQPHDGGLTSVGEVDPGLSTAANSVFFTDTTTGVRSWTSGTGALLVSNAGGMIAHDISTDGISLVWVQSQDKNASGAYQTAGLYRSTFATDAAGLAPKLLIPISCSSSICETSLRDQVATVALDPPDVSSTSFKVRRLSDGATWTLTSNGEPWELGRVANGEIWIPVIRSRSTIERVDMAALGAPGG